MSRPSPRLRPHTHSRSASVLHSCDIPQLSHHRGIAIHRASAGNRKGRSAAGVHGVVHMLNQPPSRVVKLPRTTTPPPPLLRCAIGAIASTAYMILVDCIATALPCAPLPSPNLLVPLVPARTSRCCILPAADVRCVAILAAALAGGCSERCESAASASARQGRPSRVRGVGAHRQPNQAHSWRQAIPPLLHIRQQRTSPHRMRAVDASWCASLLSRGWSTTQEPLAIRRISR